MDDLYDFILFGVCEDAREESERERKKDNYNSFDSSWNNDSPTEDECR